MPFPATLLSGVSVACLALCLILAPAGAGYDGAYAKNEKSEDKGNNGKDKDKSEERGKGRAKQEDKQRGNSASNKGASAKKDSGSSDVSDPALKPWWLEDVDTIPGRGNDDENSSSSLAFSSGLGAPRALNAGTLSTRVEALNAARMNSRSFERSTTTSRVERIAAYKAGLEELGLLQEELAATREKLAALPLPTRELDEIRADFRQARAETRRLEAEIARLQQALEDAGGSDATIENDLAAARGDLLAARALRRDLKAELDAAVEYRETLADVAELEAALTASETDALLLLAAAANKPLSNDVIAEVNRLLGLEDVVLRLTDEEEAEVQAPVH